MSQCDAERAASAAANRAAFPMLAAMVDQFRATFGPGVRLLHGIENGRELRPGQPQCDATATK